MKGLFCSHMRHGVQPLLLLATGAVVSALMMDYIFDITGNSNYMNKRLLSALGHPPGQEGPTDVYSRYELDMMRRGPRLA